MRITIIGQNLPSLKNQEKQIKEWIKKSLKELNPSLVYCGMEKGIDQTAGSIVKNMKIPLVCCYAAPKKFFHPIEKKLMDNSATIFVSLTPSKKMEEIKNNYMIDNADAVLFILDNKNISSENKKAIKYAKRQKKQIIEYKTID